MEGFASVRENLLSIQENTDEALPYDVMVWTKQRAWDALDFLTNCYSAGHPIEELAEIFPAILEDWREYARRSMNLVELGDDSGSAAHIPLRDWEFSFANQLVCFDILFHGGQDLRDISEIIDFNNPGRDGMLERLMSPFLSGRAAPPHECIRHLPYFKTLKIFDATPAARPALMAGYLDDWYVASRREVYYESHKRKDRFRGYWSWEAAAITYLLDIDDSSYRDAKFYPADLVEYARGINAPSSSAQQSTEQELRVRSGQVCPRSGAWETLDIPLQRRHFQAGDVMQAQDAAYGMTVWRYLGTEAGGTG